MGGIWGVLGGYGVVYLGVGNVVMKLGKKGVGMGGWVVVVL